MEDELWYCRDQSHRLQQMREMLAPQWTDNAAREVTLRYLDPHAEEDTRMLTGFNSQHVAMTQVGAGVDKARALILTIVERAAAIVELLELGEQELGDSNQHVEYQARSISQATAQFEQVNQLIAAAAAACEGVPTS